MTAPLQNGTAMSGAEVAQKVRRSAPVDYSQVAVAQSAPLALLSGGASGAAPLPLEAKSTSTRTPTLASERGGLNG